jgi:hypothetical protein
MNPHMCVFPAFALVAGVFCLLVLSGNTLKSTKDEERLKILLLTFLRREIGRW